MSGTEAFPTGAGKVCRVGNKLTATHQHKEQDLFHYKRKSPSEGQQSPTLVHPVLHDQVSYDCLDKSNSDQVRQTGFIGRTLRYLT